MIGSTRLLILLFAVLATVSSMGWLGGSGGGQPGGCDGDWPEEFPQEPEGFQFKCKCPCKCKPRSTTLKVSTQPPTTTTTAPSTVAVTTPTTTKETTTTSPTTTTVITTPSTTTVITTSTNVPTTTVPTSTITTTNVPTEQSETDSGVETAPTPNPPEPEGARPSGTHLEGGEIPVSNDESDGSDVAVGETRTTFWIRDPTTPKNPESVVRGGSAFSVGPPQFATVKIEGPYAPDSALDPSKIPSGDLDFGFQTVGTPKAPRKVIDPDA
ncbi:hypothetical protein CAEBREN_03204 [Caenorhabditis brenneri]|uniref:Uncharacterized protein n=1 Tax=Caenorhabditis brenneri TaxID=135651 RepID=G0MK83_CAEBE|nr:hypothetical protein CAEBREN_03204 [Caenorhabditis brenneri]